MEVIATHRTRARTVDIYFSLLFRRIFRSSKKKIILFIFLLSVGLNVGLAGGRRVRRLHSQVRHRLLYRMLGVVVRSSLRRHQVAGAIRAVLAPVVSHIPNNFLGIFSGLELADRVAPVALGLALFARCPPGRGGRAGRGALWVFTPDRKVLRPVHLGGGRFSRYSHLEILLVFLAVEPWQPEDARRIGRRGIAAKALGERAQRGLGLHLAKALHPPDDLVLPGRGIENIVGCRNRAVVPDGVELAGPVLVQIEIEVPDLL